MSETTPIQVLIFELDKARTVLARIEAFYAELQKGEAPLVNRTTRSAILLADVLVSYYTCAETVFLRISRHFENTLDPQKWHRDLLGKMCLEIPGIRERVIRDETKTCLDELLRFRHFKRYYFEFEYDWIRLEYVTKQFDRARERLRADLERFREFLVRLCGGAS